MIQKTGCSMQGKQYVKKKTWIARKNPIPCNCKKCLNCVRRKIKNSKEAYYECKIKCIGNPNEQECQYYYERPKRNRDDKVVKDKLK